MKNTFCFLFIGIEATFRTQYDVTRQSKLKRKHHSFTVKFSWLHDFSDNSSARF